MKAGPEEPGLHPPGGHRAGTRRPRVYLRTFGCRANQYDSEVVRALIESGGGEIVVTPEEADVAVFNSCAVTASAEAELRQSVRRAARRQPTLRTVVMGCASARDTGAIAALPSVTAVVAGADVPGVAMALGLEAATAVPNVQTGTRALLRIQDGCDEHCTFCATTLARGAARSRDATRLVEEASGLAERHPEIVVTGIHIGHYGIDTGDSLSALMTRLLREVPRVRFRLSSLEATEVDSTLAELFGERERLAPHLHAPLQSGADSVLKRMGRHWYTASSYAHAVERLGRQVDGLALGADLISGFPGESDADHQTTVAFLRTLPFTYFHVFPYSPRPGTAAERLTGAVPPAVANERARELRALGDQVALEHRTRRLGQTCDLVVIGGGPRREGLTEDYLTVDVDPSVPRGTRCRATIAGTPARLLGVPHEPIIRP